MLGRIVLSISERRIYFQTNIPFLFRLLTHDVFIAGKTWTTVRSTLVMNFAQDLCQSHSVYR